MLTTLLFLLAVPASAFALGLFLGLLMKLTPGVERKVKVARAVVSFCTLFRGEDYRMWADKEIEWAVRRKYPGKVPGALYEAMLKRIRG